MADNVNAAQQTKKTVADPVAAYESMAPLWARSRAVCNGERYVKEFDAVIDTIRFSNLLIPFSPSMTQQQYDFYKAEAELPGICAQYAKIIVGGLLRKKPQLMLPDSIPEEIRKEAMQWIMEEFAQDNSPLTTFLDEGLWEEVQTSRAWVYVDYPRVAEEDKANMTSEDFKALKPYPVLWQAETVIGWKKGISSVDGSQELQRVIVRGYEEKFDANEFHPDLIDTVWVHELNESGEYQIRKFQLKAPVPQVKLINGEKTPEYEKQSAAKFELVDTIPIEVNGEPATSIPAWPINGSIDPKEPLLQAFIDREVSLYNKISRRNHLLYGAATYTPYVCDDELSDEKFDEIVGKGLGSWFKLSKDGKAGVLDTPTEALQDMEKSIAATIEEMARMGIRLLSPETDQSGVALEIRNAAQTAQLGTLNTKVSNQMASIIAFMLNWRYDLELKSSDIKFTLSADFNPAPLGADWLRLATEWYQAGLIPRSIWLQILKQNDIIPPDYDDDAGQEEINGDETIVNPKEQADFANKIAEMNAVAKTGMPPSKPGQPKPTN